MEDGTNGIRVKERDRVIVSGGERACNGHGKDIWTERKGCQRCFSQLVKFSRCASGRVQHRASLFMASGLRVNARQGKRYPYYILISK